MSPTSFHCSTPRHKPPKALASAALLPRGFVFNLMQIKASAISMAQLNGLLRLHLPPIKQVVYLRPYPVKPVGDLILGWASHLDAFSAYPIQT